MTIAFNLALAFVAGLLTIVSPCVLPLAPIVIAGARAESAYGPLALAGGLAVTFGLLGGALAAVGVELGESGGIRMASAAVMLLVGLAMLIPRSAAYAERLLSPLARLSDRLAAHLPASGLAGQAAIGAILALAWAPCVGPTLGAALALAASGGSMPASMATMTVFAFGAATALLTAGYGLGKVAAAGRRVAGRTAQFGRAALGTAFALVGAAILTGADHFLETVAIGLMPNWLISLATRV